MIHDFVLRLHEDPTKLRILGDGSQAKPYVHVDDCLDGMELGLARVRAKVSCFNLAVTDQTSVHEIADGVMRAMGIDPAKVALEFTGGHAAGRGTCPS